MDEYVFEGRLADADRFNLVAEAVSLVAGASGGSERSRVAGW